MPIVWIKENSSDSEPVPRYSPSTAPDGPHTPCWLASDVAIVWAQTELKNVRRSINDMNGLKKACEKDRNIEAARWYRELIAEDTKRERALVLVLSHFIADVDGPSAFKRMRYFPIELADECDRILAQMSLFPATAERQEG